MISLIPNINLNIKYPLLRYSAVLFFFCLTSTLFAQQPGIVQDQLNWKEKASSSITPGGNIHYIGEDNGKFYYTQSAYWNTGNPLGGRLIEVDTGGTVITRNAPWSTSSNPPAPGSPGGGVVDYYVFIEDGIVYVISDDGGLHPPITPDAMIPDQDWYGGRGLHLAKYDLWGNVLYGSWIAPIWSNGSTRYTALVKDGYVYLYFAVGFPQEDSEDIVISDNAFWDMVDYWTHHDPRSNSVLYIINPDNELQFSTVILEAAILDGRWSSPMAADGNNFYMVMGVRQSDAQSNIFAPLISDDAYQSHSSIPSLLFFRISNSGILRYGTYFGRGGGDSRNPSFIVENRSAYIALDYYGGASDFPTTSGAYMDSTGSYNLPQRLLTKFSPSGDLVYTTRLGSSGSSSNSNSMIVRDGFVYYAAVVEDEIRTTSNALFSSYFSGTDQSYLAVLDPEGYPMYASYLSPNQVAGAWSILNLEIDDQRRIYIMGMTPDQDFPLTINAMKNSFSGSSSRFMSVYGTDFSLEYSSYLPGENYSSTPTSVRPIRTYDHGSFIDYIDRSHLVRFQFCPDMPPAEENTIALPDEDKVYCQFDLADVIVGSQYTLAPADLPLVRDGQILDQQRRQFFRYQWQMASDSTGPWLNIPGGNLQNLLPFIGSETLWYRRVALNPRCYDPNPSDPQHWVESNLVEVKVSQTNTAPKAFEQDRPRFTCPGVAQRLLESPGIAATGGSPPYSYEWDFRENLTSSAIPPTPDTSAYQLENPFAVVDVPTIFTLTITDSEGCRAQGQSLMSPVQADAGTDKVICDIDEGTIIGSRNNRRLLDYYLPANTGLPEGSNDITVRWDGGFQNSFRINCPWCPVTRVFPREDTIWVQSVSVFNVPGGGNGVCTTRDTMRTFVDEGPPAGFAGSDTALLEGQTGGIGITLDPLGSFDPEDYNWFWYPQTGLSTPLSNETAITATRPFGERKYTLIAERLGCIYADSVVVDIKPDMSLICAEITSSMPNVNIRYGPIIVNAPTVPGFSSHLLNYSWTLISGAEIREWTSPGGTLIKFGDPPPGFEPSVYSLDICYEGECCQIFYEIRSWNPGSGGGGTPPWSSGGGGSGGGGGFPFLFSANCPTFNPLSPTLVAFTPPLSGDLDEDYVYEWIPQEGLSSYDSRVVELIDDVGRIYTVTARSKTDPDLVYLSQIETNVIGQEIPDGLVENFYTQCGSRPVTLGNENPNPNYSFYWTGPEGFSSEESNPEVLLPGPYNVIITDAIVGCSIEDVAYVERVRSLPVDAGPDQVICGTTLVQVGTPDPYTLPFVEVVNYECNGSDGYRLEFRLDSRADFSLEFPGIDALLPVPEAEFLFGDEEEGLDYYLIYYVPDTTSAIITAKFSDECVSVLEILPPSDCQVDHKNPELRVSRPIFDSDSTYMVPFTADSADQIFLSAGWHDNLNNAVINIPLSEQLVIEALIELPGDSTITYTAVIAPPDSCGSPLLYEWTPIIAYENGTNQNSAQPQFFLSSSQIFFVTVTDTVTGCTAYDSVFIEFVNPGDIDLDLMDTTIYKVGSIVIGPDEVHHGVNYSWSPATGLSCTDCPNPIASPDETTIYILTANYPGCDPVAGFTQITVIDNDTFNISLDNHSICPGAAVSIGPPGWQYNGPQYTFSWSPSAGLSCTDCKRPIASPASSTTYTLTIFSDNSFIEQGTVNVSIIQPEIIDLGDTVNYCQGDGPVSIGPGSFYSGCTWTPALHLSSATGCNPSASPPVPTTYYFSAIDGNGCAIGDSVTVVPVGFADAGDDQSLCPGDNLQIGNLLNQGVISWSPETGLNDPASPAPVFTATSPGDYTFTVTTVFDGCEATDQVNITVHDVLFPSFDANPITCQNTCIEIGPQEVPGLSYFWTSSTDIEDPTISPITVCVGDESLDFNLRIRNDATGCIVNVPVRVVASPSAGPGIEIPDTMVCLGESFELEPIIDPSAANYDYRWSPAALVSNPFIRNPIFLADLAGDFNLRLDLTNQDNLCVGFGTGNITVFDNCEDCVVPSLSLGTAVCDDNGLTYSVLYEMSPENAILEVSAGTISENQITGIPIGERLDLIAYTAPVDSCSVTASVLAPLDCCDFPDLVVDIPPVCLSPNSYMVSFSVSGQDTVYSSSGDLICNGSECEVRNVPLGSSVIISAENDGCILSFEVSSPDDCDLVCSDFFAAGQPRCFEDGSDFYRVNFIVRDDMAVISSTHGVVTVEPNGVFGMIDSIPSSIGTTVTASLSGCEDIIEVFDPVNCPDCTEPNLVLSDPVCQSDTIYGVLFEVDITSSTTIFINAGEIDGFSVINIPIGTDLEMVVDNGQVCQDSGFVESPVSCDPCVENIIVTGTPFCNDDGSPFYSVSFLAHPEAVISVNAGVIDSTDGMRVQNVPDSLDLIIMAELDGCPVVSDTTQAPNCLLCLLPAITTGNVQCDGDYWELSYIADPFMVIKINEGILNAAAQKIESIPIGIDLELTIGRALIEGGPSVDTFTNIGNISSDRSFTGLANFPSACPGTFTINVPEGKYISGMDVLYGISTASTGRFHNQRSRLYSPTLGTGEEVVYAGEGNVSGTLWYERNNIDFANGATGEIVIEMHVGRTWGGFGCNISYQRILSGNFTLVVYYSDFVDEECNYQKTISSPNCDPGTCIDPDLWTSQPICQDENYYSVFYGENTGADISVNAGVVSGDLVVDIPIDTDLQIMATNGSCQAVQQINSPEDCSNNCLVPSFALGMPDCSSDGSKFYSVPIYRQPGTELQINAGSLVGNRIIGIPSGVDLEVGGFVQGCPIYSASVLSPVCGPCYKPMLTLGGFECSGVSYSLEFQASTGATIRSNFGQLENNRITDIPIGEDVLVSAHYNLDGFNEPVEGCRVEIEFQSPANCDPACEFPDLSVSQAVCQDESFYQVAFTETTGASIGVTAGELSGNSVINIPVGEDLLIIAEDNGCQVSLQVQGPEDCNIVCSNSALGVGLAECFPDGSEFYRIPYVAHPDAVISVSTGQIEEGYINNISTYTSTTVIAQIPGCPSDTLVVDAIPCPECPTSAFEAGDIICQPVINTYSFPFQIDPYTTISVDTGYVDLEEGMIWGVPLGVDVTVTVELLGSQTDQFSYGPVIIPSDLVGLNPDPEPFSSCPGSIFIDLPDYRRVESLTTNYWFTAQGSGRRFHQRSWLWSPDMGVGEEEVAAGTGTLSGHVNYTRSLDFATGWLGSFEIELHAGRTSVGTGCSQTANFINTFTRWSLTLTHGLRQGGGGCSFEVIVEAPDICPCELPELSTGLVECEAGDSTYSVSYFVEEGVFVAADTGIIGDSIITGIPVGHDLRIFASYPTSVPLGPTPLLYLLNEWAEKIHRYVISTENLSLIPDLNYSFDTGIRGFSISVDPTTGQMYYMGGSNNFRSLYAIDPQAQELSASMGQIVSQSSNNQPESMTFSADGTLFAVFNGGELNTIDLPSLNANYFADFPVSDGPVGLTFDYDQNRIIYTTGANPVQVYGVSIVDSSVTLITTFQHPQNIWGGTSAVQYIGDNQLLVGRDQNSQPGWIVHVDLDNGNTMVIDDSDPFPNNRPMKSFAIQTGETNLSVPGLNDSCLVERQIISPDCSQICDQPGLIVGPTFCMTDSTYYLTFWITASSDSVWVSCGNIEVLSDSLYRVFDIPITCDVEIAVFDGDCEDRQIISSPGEVCLDPCNFVPVLGPSECYADGSGLYSVPILTPLPEGTEVIVSSGEVTNTAIINIPSGSVEIMIFFPACDTFFFDREAECVECPYPFEVGEPICHSDGSRNYYVPYNLPDGAVVISAVGTVTDTAIIDIPPGTIEFSIEYDVCPAQEYEFSEFCLDCVRPSLTVGHTVCTSDSTYSVEFNASEGALVFASSGTLQGNRVRDIALADNLEITARLSDRVFMDTLSLIIGMDFFPVETFWDIRDSDGNTVFFGGPYSNLDPGDTVEYLLPLVEGEYLFTIYDLVCDGLCCSTPLAGFYRLEDYRTGELLAEGGEFGCLESVELNWEPRMPLDDCEVSMLVNSPEGCDQICQQPNLWVSQGVCDDEFTYSVLFNESTGAVLSVNLGAIDGNTITGIPVGQDLIVSASNGACLQTITIESPVDCENLCESSSPAVGLPFCAAGGTNYYSVAYLAHPDAVVTSSHGVIGSGIITDIPSNTDVLIVGHVPDCLPDSVLVSGIQCPPCVLPALTVGDIRCDSLSGTYSVEFFAPDNAIVTTSSGWVAANSILDIPLSESVTISAFRGDGCASAINVDPPSECDVPYGCPEFWVSQGVCLDPLNYGVVFSNPSGADLTTNAGIVQGNQVLDIPIGTDLEITASNMECNISITIDSPDNCIENCGNSPIGISGPVCQGSTYFYSVNYIAHPDAVITSSGGVVQPGMIVDIPSGPVEISAQIPDCQEERIVIYEYCPDCIKPPLTIGKVQCEMFDETYSVEFLTSSDAIVMAGSGTILGNKVLDIPIGESLELSSGRKLSVPWIELTLELRFDQFPLETSWELLDENGLTIFSGDSYAFDLAHTSIYETMFVRPGCYELIVRDFGGDGMCCIYGNGYFRLLNESAGGVEIAFGDEFGAIQRNEFCVEQEDQIQSSCVTRLVVDSPDQCLFDCDYPDLSVSQPVCAGGGFYRVSISETTGADITVNAGNLDSSSVDLVPIGTDLVVTASNGPCEISISVNGDISCENPCSNPAIGLGLPFCATDQTYQINYVAADNAIITVSHGSVVSGRIIDVPLMADLLIQSEIPGCRIDSFWVATPDCDQCVLPVLATGTSQCSEDGDTWFYHFTVSEDAIVTSTLGTVSGNVVSGLPLGGVDTLRAQRTIDYDFHLVDLEITFDNEPNNRFTWQVLNQDGVIVAESDGAYTGIEPGEVMVESLMLVPGAYTFRIRDAWWSGLCCDYGEGYYVLRNVSTGDTLALGGDFDVSESVPFTLDEFRLIEDCIVTRIKGGPTSCGDTLDCQNPMLEILDIECQSSGLFYDVVFVETTGASVVASAGTVVGDSVVMNIPVGFHLRLDAFNFGDNDTCSVYEIVQSPNCPLPLECQPPYKSVLSVDCSTEDSYSVTLSGQPDLGVESDFGSVSFESGVWIVSDIPLTQDVQIWGAPDGCDLDTLNVSPPQCVYADIRLLLQGTLNPGDSIMHDLLREKGFLPIQDPYFEMSNNRFTRYGEEGSQISTSGTLLNQSDNENEAIVDWVFIEFRNSSDPTLIEFTRSALITREGKVVNPLDGHSPLELGGIVDGSYYVSVKHRNHLGVMTASPVSFSQGVTTVDFRTMEPQDMYLADGWSDFEGWQQTPPIYDGMRALWGGDANSDGRIVFTGSGASDLVVISNAVFLASFFDIGIVSQTYSALEGYYDSDINMDGRVLSVGGDSDKALIQFNVQNLSNEIMGSQLFNWQLFVEQIPVNP